MDRKAVRVAVRSAGARSINAGKEFLEIGNRQSTFGNSSCGGIAQLVERQLCKLEVRGSNPLASISKEMEAEMRRQFDWRGALRARVKSEAHSPEPKCRFG
jgi:hypothetical protein